MAENITRRKFVKSAGIIPLSAAAGTAVTLGDSIAQIQKSGKKRLKLGCCAYSYRDYLKANGGMTLEDFINLCADMDLDGVDLTSYYFPETHTDDYLYLLKRKAFLAGIEISGTAVGNNFCQADAAVRQKQVSLVKTWIEKGEKFGAPCIRVFGGSRIPQGHAEDEAHKWVVDCLTECAEYGSKHGVVLVLENHGGFPSTSAQVIRILKAVNSDWCKANLDVGNFKTDPYNEIAKVAPYAANVHIKGEMTTPDAKSVPADIPRVVQLLRDANFKGYMAIEYESKEDAKTGVPKLISQIRAAMA